MAGASGPDLGLAPCGLHPDPNLSVDSRRAGYVGVAVGKDHVGRQRSLLREGGYERGVGADDCVSSEAGASAGRAVALGAAREQEPGGRCVTVSWWGRCRVASRRAGCRG
jgi:hypothetical protein